VFYLFHGEDEFSQREQLAAFKAKLGDPSLVALNTSAFDGRTVTLGELRHACDSIPFLADVRLVVVEGWLTHLASRRSGEKAASDEPAASSKKIIEELVTYLPLLPETTRLVFVEPKKVRDNHPVLLLAKSDPKRGIVKAFEPPKGDALIDWIIARATMQGGAISFPAAQLLAESVGEDLRLLDGEVAKLLAYVAGKRPAGEADVKLLTPYAGEADIFQMVDALGQRRGEMATRLMHRLLDGGKHPLELLSMIARQFRLLIQAKELLGEGQRPAAIAKELGVPPFVADKLARQTHNFSLPQLEAVYHRLLEIDVAIKTGEMDGTLALDLLVAGLA
jgi:DNA polymerase-3 subunit delta